MTRISIPAICLFVTAMFVALLATGTPIAVEGPQRSAIETGIQPPDPALADPALDGRTLEPATLDESAGAPAACQVFCSTDEFCNRGCPILSLCHNHRCQAF